jgi:VanZ family protein
MPSTYWPRLEPATILAAMLQSPVRAPVTTLSKLTFALFWLALFIATHIPTPPDLLPPNGGDKLAHFGAYLVLALLLATAWELAGGVRTRRHLIFAWFAVLGYAVFDEVTQTLVGRDCEFWDWLADASGAAIGLLLFVLLRKLLSARAQ